MESKRGISNTEFGAVQLKISLVSLILTASLGGAAIWYQIRYFEHYPYFFDPVSYSLRNISLFLQLSQTNRLALALNEWLNFSRAPLRTVPLILVNPDLLASNVGYVATSLPTLLIFLLVLGKTTYRRTCSLGYSLTTIFLFCSIPGLWNLKYGLGAYWLDLPASLLVGAAALALLNFLETDYLTWLALFSTLTACASLCRYIAVAYLLVTCTPILIGYSFKNRLWHKPFKQFILPKLVALLLPFITLAGYYVIAQFQFNYEYYTVYGYSLNQDRTQSLLSMIHFIRSSFLGQLLTVVLILIFSLNLLVIRFQILKYWQPLAIAIWYTFSIVFFLTFLGSVEAFHSTMYVVPLIYFSAVSPTPCFREHFNQSSRRLMLFLIAILILLSIFSIKQTFSQNFYLSTHPDPNAKALKHLDLELAKIIVKENTGREPLSWQPYFDERSEMPSTEAFYISGKLPRILRKLSTDHEALFTTHEAYWKAWYPGLDPSMVSSKVYESTGKNMDLAVVFDDPKQAFKVQGTNNNSYSQIVAFDIARRLPKDSNWQFITTIENENYGNLAAYRNLSRVKQFEPRGS